MAITALPTPPSRSTPSTFSTLADAFLGALPTFAIEANAVAEAMNLNDTSDTSASSITIGTGAKTFTVSAGKSFLPGMSLKIARTSSPSNWMFGDVTTYSSTTLVMNILSIQGSGGPFTDWTISFASTGLLLTETSEAVGFTIAGGTTSKTLTVPLDASVSGTNTGDQIVTLPANHLSGLAMSHAADTEHDITIAAGKARDAADAQDIVLASTLTKRADAAWAVGTTNGGMDTGAIPTSGTLHVWLIKRSDTGVVDALFSISATAPTMPANYDYKRLIGSYRTNATDNIINGDWWGTGLLRTFMYDTPILDVDATNPGTNAVTAAISTPGGIVTKALIFAGVASCYAYFSALNNTDMAPSVTATPLSNAGGVGVTGGPNPVAIFTNTSSQIRYRVSASGTGEKAISVTAGYEMSL